MSKKYSLRSANGRFVRKKKEAHKFKVVAAMHAAKKKILENLLLKEKKTISEDFNGRRIIEMKELAENLVCSKCQEVLSLINIVRENRKGLLSTFDVNCSKCNATTCVRTGKVDNKISDTTKAVILGTVHAGLGCTALNKILSCADIPTVSNNIYKKYEREVGKAIEKVAKESCKRAAEEERHLVIENILKICEELPSDIVNDVYPQMDALKSSASKDTPMDNEKGETVFDSALGEVVNIIVSYDMGWSKRGTGRSYDSLNGYSSIIGFLSGKILDYATRNRKCKLCDLGHQKNDHDCRQNFQGSAKAMEADAGAELINNSNVLKEMNLKVRVMVGDEDSSTIAAVRKYDPTTTIYKLADKNHLVKHFVGELYELGKRFRELIKKGVIPHIKKCFTYAIAQNKGKSDELSTVLKRIPDHLFNLHENCGEWCNRLTDSTSQSVILKDSLLYNELSQLFVKYANNAYKFSVSASSQGNESFNNIVAHKAPKNTCYSRSESCDFRVANAVCVKNNGESSLFNIKKEMNLTCSKNTAAFIARTDQNRKKGKEKCQTKSAKLQRHKLKEKRDNLRKLKESSEGIQYQSNCGIELDAQKQNLKQITELKGVISTTILKKMAKENITYNMLEEIFKRGGENEIVKLLSYSFGSKKPRVTKNKKVLEKIIRRLEGYQV